MQAEVGRKGALIEAQGVRAIKIKGRVLKAPDISLVVCTGVAQE